MTWEDLQEETTTDLVEYVRSIKDPGYKELAEAAFITLTFRFRKDLIDKCVVMCTKWNRSEDDAIELANRVFHRFLKYPRYDPLKCKDGKVDECFRRYLYGIANREMVSFFNPAESIYDGTETIVTSLIDTNKIYEPEKLKLLQAYEARLDAIFAKLSSKHKTIFLTYRLHGREGHNLPGHLLAELREALGLTQNTVRFYKMEAFELVNKELKNG